MISSIVRAKKLHATAMRGISRWVSRNNNAEFNHERKEMRKELGVIRKQYLEEHWEEVAKQEDQYLEEFEETKFKRWRK